MTYKEARDSGQPFNRKIYKDGWYLHDPKRKTDWSVTDLSIRIWSKKDLEANDWIIEQEKKER